MWTIELIADLFVEGDEIHGLSPVKLCNQLSNIIPSIAAIE
jgi:hypothetical protein